MKLKNIGIMLILFVIMIFGLYGNAEAGWSKTQWGMGIKEIEEVMPGQVKVISPDLKKNYPRGEYWIQGYRISNYSFNVIFLFDSKKKLNGVSMYNFTTDINESNKCFQAMKDELKKKYGPPSSENLKNEDTTTADWITSDTLITIKYEKPSWIKIYWVYLTYQSRESESAGEL